MLEAQRLEQRTNFDLEMIAATGSCAGIENYSRFLTGRMPGEPPPTLFEYLPENALLFVDESHQTVPQIGAMARGDHRRKITLAEYGFRLPSCIDNRPLRFNEWDAMRPQTFAVSATPGTWEMEQTGGVFAEQVIRPTGLIDPPVEIKPVEDQVQDCIEECKATAAKGDRTLVTRADAPAQPCLCRPAGLETTYNRTPLQVARPCRCCSACASSRGTQIAAAIAETHCG